MIEKIAEAEALKIAQEWRKIFFELKKRDEKIAATRGKITGAFFNILKKAEKGRVLTRAELIALLKTENKKELAALYSTANGVRAKYLKNSCCVHGIIEFSNYCSMNCHYCGIGRDNSQLQRYRMDEDEIIETAEHAVKKLGFKALVLQSGEDLSYTTERLVRIVKGIRERCSVLLFMSVGERDVDCYKRMYDAGARAVLLRFETSNAMIYKRLRPGRKLEDRLALIKRLGEIGYLVATGFLTGLPGETEQDLINNIFLTKSLKPEMWSFGPLIPHPQTPLAAVQKQPLDNVLKIIAVSRLVDNEAKIVVTTAMETLDKSGRKAGLLAGANSLMINVTPERYRRLYELYPNKAGGEKTVERNINETLELLYSLGRAPTDLGI